MNVETLREQLPAAMQRAGLLEDQPPPAAVRWIDTFARAFGERCPTIEAAVEQVAELRAEAVAIPAFSLERLRSREVLYFLDAVGQYVDHQPELRDLPVDDEIAVLARTYGLDLDDARWAVRVALTGREDGPPFDLLFPLLGHDRIVIRIGAVNSKLLHGRGLDPVKFGPGGKPFEPISGRRP